MRPKRKRLKKGVRTIIRKNSYVIKRLGLPPVRSLEVTNIHGNLYAKAPDGELILLYASERFIEAFKQSLLISPAGDAWVPPGDNFVVEFNVEPYKESAQVVERINGDWLEGIKDPIGPIKSYNGIVKEE